MSCKRVFCKKVDTKFTQVSLALLGKCVSLALVGQPSNGVTKNVTYRLDILLHQPTSDPCFPVGLLKTESELLDQLRLTYGDFKWWYPWLMLMIIFFFCFLTPDLSP